MLENLVGSGGGTVHCVDSFLGGEEHEDIDFTQVRRNFENNVRATRKAELAHLHEGQSFDKLVDLYRAGVRADLIYLDASHRATDVLSDLVLSHRIARVGGIVICDDYLWRVEDPRKVDVLSTPKIAIDSFTNIYRQQIDFFIDFPLYQFVYRRVA